MNSERKLRCAIYVRKSTDEGLDQAFNSLDAQREACEAFVRSHSAEGWVLATENYADGGFSGGTVERPSLQRLLRDITDGKIQIIVVYKVDRLTRSLADFVRIVEMLDARGASFVSVTQQFNTTSSMGRLTLNVLLSFAQFEREVTSERIRDKIAASKRRGLWTGGFVPLGYDVRDRQLIVNEGEAVLVRRIFERYLALSSVKALCTELDRTGIKGKARRSGDRLLCLPLRRGALHHILRNRLYLGEVSHKGQIYPGAHAAIIDLALWKNVQRTLAAQSRAARATKPSSYLLQGLLYGERGEPMTGQHTTKSGRRYCYYASRAPSSKDPNHLAQRVPAASLEALVSSRLSDLLGDKYELARHLKLNSDLALVASCEAKAEKFRSELAGAKREERLRLVRSVLTRAEVHANRVRVSFDRAALAASLGLETPIDPGAFCVEVEARLLRAGLGKRLIVRGPGAAPFIDAALVALVRRAYRVRARFVAEPGLTVKEVAASEGVVSSYIARLIRISFLAPDIVEAILNGRQPATLTASALLADRILPAIWEDQRRKFGVEAFQKAIAGTPLRARRRHHHPRTATERPSLPLFQHTRNNTHS